MWFVSLSLHSVVKFAHNIADIMNGGMKEWIEWKTPNNRERKEEKQNESKRKTSNNREKTGKNKQIMECYATH